MIYHDFWQQLTSTYETGEAKAVARYVFEHCFGLTMADLLCGKDSLLTESEQARLQALCQRLLTGEPVQYVTGVAEFGPLLLHVEPGVLIPRPETYELCQWVKNDSRRYGGTEIRGYENSFSNGDSSANANLVPQHLRTPVPPGNAPKILDIGTGSGCIAITLAQTYHSVTAWDISDEALRIAAKNAETTGVSVTFEKHDILTSLSPQISTLNPRWDIIVSNPPYICRNEQHAMEQNVLAFEPHLALFVPDDDPLLFYRAIARYAKHALNPGGRMYFEINPLYHTELLQLLATEGFTAITSRRDQFGKTRFVRASTGN
ncbi:MAG: peptide chain release factor N(5)-glutamine methyltransferase [Prevotella sp.]|nr:peptide chain release factor N(5)-glutamine methyltransferase [Prevotella sp.]